MFIMKISHTLKGFDSLSLLITSFIRTKFLISCLLYSFGYKNFDGDHEFQTKNQHHRSFTIHSIFIKLIANTFEGMNPLKNYHPIFTVKSFDNHHYYDLAISIRREIRLLKYGDCERLSMFYFHDGDTFLEFGFFAVSFEFVNSYFISWPILKKISAETSFLDLVER